MLDPGLWSLAGGWQPDDHTTLRHDHESWSFELWTAVNSPVWCGPSSYIQIRAQPGSKVVISTLGPSLQALSLCSFNLSQQNHVYQWSIHCSIHITPKLTEINSFNKYGHGCSSVSESLSRLPTVGDVVLWLHHPDIAPVWPPMRDPCPQLQCSATPAPRLQTRRRESGIRSNNYASDLLLAAGKVLCSGSQNNTNIFGVFPGL